MSELNCLTELSTDEVIMNSLVAAADPAHGMSIQQLTATANKISLQVVSSNPQIARSDYQYVLQVTQGTAYFENGSCENQQRIAGRGAEILELTLLDASAGQLVAGWAAGHEAVKLTPVFELGSDEKEDAMEVLEEAGEELIIEEVAKVAEAEKEAAMVVEAAKESESEQKAASVAQEDEKMAQIKEDLLNAAEEKDLTGEYAELDENPLDEAVENEALDYSSKEAVKEDKTVSEEEKEDRRKGHRQKPKLTKTKSRRKKHKNRHQIADEAKQRIMDGVNDIKLSKFGPESTDEDMRDTLAKATDLNRRAKDNYARLRDIEIDSSKTQFKKAELRRDLETFPTTTGSYLTGMFLLVSLSLGSIKLFLNLGRHKGRRDL